MRSSPHLRSLLLAIALASAWAGALACDDGDGTFAPNPVDSDGDAGAFSDAALGPGDA